MDELNERLDTGIQKYPKLDFFRSQRSWELYRQGRFEVAQDVARQAATTE